MTQHHSIQPNVLIVTTIFSVTAILAVLVDVNGQQSISFGATAVAKTRPNILWTPPKTLGAPKTTSAGGTRGQVQTRCAVGKSAQPTKIALLTPTTRESLLTTAPNPTFAWYVDTANVVSMKFLLTDPKVAQPIFSQTLQADRPGIVQVTLPTHLALQSGTKYRWTVLTTCSDRPTEVVHARSFIERVDNVKLPTPTGTPIEKAAAYAINGIWYDALNTLLVAQSNGDPAIKSALKALLSQTDNSFITEVAMKLDRD
jgi:Domain of Unknown Function (DUF928)